MNNAENSSDFAFLVKTRSPNRSLDVLVIVLVWYYRMYRVPYLLLFVVLASQLEV